jgi:hypothetical protein
MWNTMYLAITLPNRSPAVVSVHVEPVQAEYGPTTHAQRFFICLGRIHFLFAHVRGFWGVPIELQAV